MFYLITLIMQGPRPSVHVINLISIVLFLSEASKYLLQYLAQCSSHAGKVDVVKDRLIQSNPVLEVCTYIHNRASTHTLITLRPSES